MSYISAKYLFEGRDPVRSKIALNNIIEQINTFNYESNQQDATM